MIKKTIKVSVKGFVQGVGFRVFVKKIADKFGVVGYVKNEEDGSVVIVAQGEEKTIDRIIDFCKNGPRFAKIEKIEIEQLNNGEDFKEFLTL